MTGGEIGFSPPSQLKLARAGFESSICRFGNIRLCNKRDVARAGKYQQVLGSCALGLGELFCWRDVLL
jgi:hypothetical protein